MNNVIPFRYHGQPVRFSGDGWINATEAAKQFGKLPHEWLRLPETKAYLDALERRCGKIPHVKTSKARADRGGGTWLHPKLTVAFARWLSPDFAVWCDLQIDALLHGDTPAQQHFDRACKALASGQQLASLSGKQLAEWRWSKPGLEQQVEHWRDQLQMTLALDHGSAA